MQFGSKLATCVVAFAGVALLSAKTPGGSDPASYKFREPLINSKGVQSIAELRGKPVLIDFWGVNCPPCVGAAVPASVKLQRELGDDLQVIFVESQNTDRVTMEAFAWRHKWMGTNAMWTTEPPMELTGNGLPQFVLLDNQGQVLLQGHPLENPKQIEEAIADQIKKSKSAPEGTPAKVGKAYAIYAKGDIAGAIAECDKLATDASLSEAVKAAREDLLGRATASVGRAKWLIDNGYVADATTLLAGLAKSTKANATLSASVAEQAARLSEPANVSEVEASKALDNLLEKMTKDKPFEEGNVKALERIADKYKGTKTAERAAHTVSLAKSKMPASGL